MNNLVSSIRDLKLRIEKQFKVKEIQLFGSNVRGEQREDIDIDVLVEFEEGADLFDPGWFSHFPGGTTSAKGRCHSQERFAGRT